MIGFCHILTITLPSTLLLFFCYDGRLTITFIKLYRGIISFIFLSRLFHRFIEFLWRAGFLIGLIVIFTVTYANILVSNESLWFGINIFNYNILMILLLFNGTNDTPFFRNWMKIRAIFACSTRIPRNEFLANLRFINQWMIKNLFLWMRIHTIISIILSHANCRHFTLIWRMRYFLRKIKLVGLGICFLNKIRAYYW